MTTFKVKDQDRNIITGTVLAGQRGDQVLRLPEADLGCLNGPKGGKGFYIGSDGQKYEALDKENAPGKWDKK